MRTITTTLFVATLLAAGCAKNRAVEAPTTIPMPTSITKSRPADLPATVDQMVANFSRVHFAYDSATLDAASKAALTDNVRIMQQNPEVKVQVQGHCDERGTTEYNLALGERRANAVSSFMQQSGVSVSRLSTVSYGEEAPLASTHDEVAWSENRRAEFRITWGEGVSGTVGTR